MADPNDIAHLLRRTEFIARPARVAELAPLTLEAAVDDVLDFGRNAPYPLLAGMDLNDNPNRWSQWPMLHDWWLEAMARQPRPFQEKMTLFWHGHFTTEWESTENNRLVYDQLDLYRQNALGDFRLLTHAMSRDPQMLRYLSNASNVKGRPNQNFARELFELFTLGVGNYTQDDIEASSRAWTGHNLLYTNWSTQSYVFNASQHDTGNKTLFGITRNWDGPEVIDHVLRDDPTLQRVAARLIARKLWSFLAHPTPDDALVDTLATEFIASGMQIRPLVRAILLRPEFYSAASREGLVRSPVDWCVAIMATTGLTSSSIQVFNWGERMGQRVTAPPNVAGWKPNDYFLTTASMSARANVARRVASLLRANNGFDHLFPMTTAQAVDTVAAYFGIEPLSPLTRQALIAAYDAERTAVGGQVTRAVTNLLIMALLTGEMNVA